jgi:endonuclease VIII
MPEGDTIFRAARTLHRALAGKTVVRFETVLVQLERMRIDSPIVGRTVERVESRGKHLLMQFSGDLVLRTHMRMNGSWHIYRPGERWQRPHSDMRIVIATDDFEAVAFRVPVAEFRTAGSLKRDRVIASLGPDLLDPDADLDEAVNRLRERGPMAIADALLDQTALAGIGNVHKSEALFAAGVSPFATVASLSDDVLRAIVTTAREQLVANTRDHREALSARGGMRRTTGSLHPDARLWVCGRAGEPCRRCGTPIAMAKQGEGVRLTYYCPGCQHVASVQSPLR